MFEVFIRDLEFHARIGVSEEEKALGHQFRASVLVRVDGNADRTDLIEGTVDYGELASLVLSVAASGPFSTVEYVAGLVADAVLRDHPAARECTVELVKILPPQSKDKPLAGLLREAGARVARARS